MDRTAFEQMVNSIKDGDNSALSPLNAYQQACIGLLRKKSNGACSMDDAYDLFIDAILDFRSNVLRDKVSYKNIRAYLMQICWNKWQAEYRRRKRIHEKSRMVEKRLYENESRDLDTAISEHRLKIIKESMLQISDNCRKILRAFILDSLSMKEIAELMGFANAQVAKTTKSRCYKKLLQAIDENNNDD